MTGSARGNNSMVRRLRALPWPPKRWGIRLRSAVMSMAVIAVALGAVSLALLLTLKATLESAGAGDASTRAGQIATALQEDSPGQLDEVLLASDGNTLITQIVDPTGAMVRSTAGSSAPVLTAVRPPVGTLIDVGRLELPGGGGDYWVVVQTVATATGPVYVIVGSFQEPTEDTLNTVAVGLGIAAPVIVAVVGTATFFLVGRALKPVEMIRRQVADISSADLTGRVPEPSSTDEIARLARTMNDMLARLEAGQANQQAFVGNASHELRSPLTTIITALELGRQRPEFIDQSLVATTLLPEARRMQHLVDDLLLLATADEKGLRPRLADIDLDDLVDTETRRQRALPSSAGKTITVQAPPIRIRGDLGQLTRALRNILDNAVRHADRAVHTTVSAVDGTAQITVGDDGTGIPEPDRHRVMERFVRLDADRSRTAGGTGLGLPIVAEIVTAHHGSLTVNTSPLGGAEIAVTLPLDPAELSHAPSQ